MGVLIRDLALSNLFIIFLIILGGLALIKIVKNQLEK